MEKDMDYETGQATMSKKKVKIKPDYISIHI
jgi:hypothetical protein